MNREPFGNTILGAGLAVAVIILAMTTCIRFAGHA